MSTNIEQFSYVLKLVAPLRLLPGLHERPFSASAAIWIITVDPPQRRKNSQLAGARRVALKMSRLLRCSSVTYRSIRRAVECGHGMLVEAGDEDDQRRRRFGRQGL